MQPLLSTLALALCAIAATASPAPSLLEARQGTTSLASVTCGSTTYTKKQVDDAVAEGCRLYAANEQIGTSKYPHQFNNREGLVFAASGPYQEFPILQSGVYAGKAPGADRVVFNPSYKGECVYVGAMTHTDANSRNGFVSCTEKQSSSSSGGSGTGNSQTTTSNTKTTSSATQTATTAATTSPNAAVGGLASIGGQGVVAGVLAGLLLV
ncbi:hypothetical protein VTI74DRAFT_1883 [Chaetomium olivicolor]